MSQQGNQKTQEDGLEVEYRELCQDWRYRDKNVVDRLSTAGILFTLLGVALGVIPQWMYVVRLCLLAMGWLFCLILSISVAKDIYFRDGSEKLLIRIAARLGITRCIQTLKSLVFADGLNFEKLKFLRKISIEKEEFSIEIPGWLKDCPSARVTFDWLKDWLLARATFGWILAFYLLVLLIFSALFILILFNSIFHWSLPI